MIRANRLYHGDCLELMKRIPSGIVDLILSDLPYGATRHADDVPISLDRLWSGYKRILKPSGTVVLTAQLPFTVDLINSNRSWFRYEWVWDKVLSSGFLSANRRPLRVHEHILVFYPRLGTYHPQRRPGQPNHSKGQPKTCPNNNYGDHRMVDNAPRLGIMKHPTSILTIPKPHPSKARHRTEKPVGLAEYLIKTYSNPGDLVLDSCMGAGWTVVACRRTGRRFIGIDKDTRCVQIAQRRLAGAAKATGEELAGRSGPNRKI